MNDELNSQIDSVEFIDATQNAVIEAVDNVSELITETSLTTEQDGHAHEIFYKTAEFWVGFAFILVVVALSKPVSKLLRAMLVKRRNEIIDRINDAEKLHDDAQKLLAEYERKFINAQKEADAILQKSNELVQKTRESETKKLNNELNQKRKEADNLIAAAQSRILNEINTKTSTKAINAAKAYILDHLDTKAKSKLIDESIKNIIAKI